ncbi:MAG: ribonucleotide reductase subunit alpha [Pseudomonadota bacterium]|nr:ribonucleotide reductase subunit alpha [Pseudomonadota bacterium]QKK06413.1 MAG: ribonucleotide reductase subunit alpha [Pseudomonadota bacterium]
MHGLLFLKEKTIHITDYNSLLSVAREQAEPQRLLFVFLKIYKPEGREDAEERDTDFGGGGELEAIMCVDKALEELGSFADLVAESERIEKNWHIVLVACLAGKNGIAPTSDDATQPLKMMVQTIEKGGSLSNFMAFDRNGDPIQFSH